MHVANYGKPVKLCQFDRAKKDLKKIIRLSKNSRRNPPLKDIHPKILLGTNLSKIKLENLMRIYDKNLVTFIDVPTPVPQKYQRQSNNFKYNKLRHQFRLGRAPYQITMPFG